MLGFIGSLFGAGRIAGLLEAALRFLTSAGGIVVIFVVSTWYANHSGRVAEREVCQAEAVLAESNELRRQLEASKRVAAEDRAALQAEQLANDQLQQRIAKHEAALEAAGGSGCPALTADDIRRLQ